jgi:hypothetical protein
MARNEEKAQAMLNRWWNMKKNLNRTPARERPTSHYKIMQISRVNDCEKFRYIFYFLFFLLNIE